MTIAQLSPFGLTNPQGQVFATAAEASALLLSDATTKITVADVQYSDVGSSEPAHSLKIQNGSRWFEIDGPFYPVARVMTGHGMTATQACVAIAAVMELRGFGEMYFDRKAGDFHVQNSSSNGIGGRYVMKFTTVGIDIRITGNGAVIVNDGTSVANYANFIDADRLGKTSRIHIDGLVYRYANKPYVTGTITATSVGNYIDILADWHPSFGYVKVGHFYGDKRLAGAFYYHPTIGSDAGLPITQTAGLNYRVDITGASLSIPSVGTDVALVHRKYDAFFLTANNIGDLYVGPGVLIEDTAGMAIYVNKAQSVHIDGARIAPNPADRVPYGVNADGWHLKSCLNARVTNCEVGFTGDDNLNVGSAVFVVASRDSSTQMTVTKAYRTVLEAGDFIQIFDANRALSLETRVVSVDADLTTTYQITVEDTLDVGVDNTYHICIPTLTGTITGNTFGDTNYRGMLAFARSLLVSGNNINRTNSAGIYIYSAANEHCYIFNALVTGNKLTRCNTVDGTQAGAIVARAVTGANALTTAAAFRTIVIQDNTIDDTKQGGIAVYGSATVLVTRNILANIATSATAIDGFTGSAIALYGVAEARVSGNELNGSTFRTVDCISVSELRFGPNFNIRRSSSLAASAFKFDELPRFNIASLPPSPANGLLGYVPDAGGVAALVFSGSNNLWNKVPSFSSATLAGNADFTRTPITDPTVNIHTGTLTADRTVTLATTNAVNGSMFVFCRTGAGAFNLNIGGLKSLATNTWCVVVYNGSAWVLLMYGAL